MDYKYGLYHKLMLINEVEGLVEQVLVNVIDYIEHILIEVKCEKIIYLKYNVQIYQMLSYY